MIFSLEEGAYIVGAAAVSSMGAVIVGWLSLKASRATRKENAAQHGSVHGVLLELVAQTRRNGAVLQSILKTYTVPMIETDTQGALLDMNLAAREVMGLSLREAAGEGWTKAVHPDDLTRLRDSWFEAVHSSYPWGPVKFRYVHRDGTVITVIGEAVPVHDAHDAVTGWVASVQVINTEEPTS